MEGPSIHLAAEQLQPFAGRRITRVTGNSTIGIERLRAKTLREVFAWGKHLVLQFDRFALRIHFMLWGTFAASVNSRLLTGDYRRSGAPRLVMTFRNGEITVWSASLKYIEGAHARERYDFTTDILSNTWDPAAALAKVRQLPESQIADVLLDQAIFAGVGNIIKNEVLFRTRTNPFAKVGRLSTHKLKAIVADARTFSFRFLEWRRIFELRKHLELYGKSTCRVCGGRIGRRVHGERARRSFFCVTCQKIRTIPRQVTFRTRSSLR